MKSLSAVLRTFLPTLIVCGVIQFIIGNAPVSPIILILVISGLASITLLPGTIRSIKIYLGTVNRVTRDVSHEQRPYPSEERRIPNELEALGFERVGELAVDLPGQKDATEWVFKNPAETIVAEVIYFSGKPALEMVNFASWFAGERVVETSYPVGDDILTDDYRSACNHESVQETLRTHFVEMAKFQHRYGVPIRFNSIADMMPYDVIYRQKYARRRMRTSFLQSLATLLLMFDVVPFVLMMFVLESGNANMLLALLLVVVVGVISLLATFMWLWIMLRSLLLRYRFIKAQQ